MPYRIVSYQCFCRMRFNQPHLPAILLTRSERSPQVRLPPPPLLFARITSTLNYKDEPKMHEQVHARPAKDKDKDSPFDQETRLCLFYTKYKAVLHPVCYSVFFTPAHDICVIFFVRFYRDRCTLAPSCLSVLQQRTNAPTSAHIVMTTHAGASMPGRRNFVQYGHQNELYSPLLSSCRRYAS